MTTENRFGPVIEGDVEFPLGKLGQRVEELGGTTLLVTGATGFLCSYFATVNDKGLNLACKVVAVDNLRTRNSVALRGPVSHALGALRRGRSFPAVWPLRVRSYQ